MGVIRGAQFCVSNAILNLYVLSNICTKVKLRFLYHVVECG